MSRSELFYNVSKFLIKIFEKSQICFALRNGVFLLDLDGIFVFVITDRVIEWKQFMMGDSEVPLLYAALCIFSGNKDN